MTSGERPIFWQEADFCQKISLFCPSALFPLKINKFLTFDSNSTSGFYELDVLKMNKETTLMLRSLWVLMKWLPNKRSCSVAANIFGINFLPNEFCSEEVLNVTITTSSAKSSFASSMSFVNLIHTWLENLALALLSPRCKGYWVSRSINMITGTED